MSIYETKYDNPPTPDPYGAAPAPDVRSRMTPGGAFILDAPDHVPARWGHGDEVLWAEGEALTIAGPPGVGKTTLAGQIVRGCLLGGDLLGLPIRPARRVLYLAMDRPRQIARALRRNLGDVGRDVLDDRLVVWPGPPIVDIAKVPETLVGYARLAEADVVIVDSLKDAAVGLSEDAVGAGYNRARQMCLAEGVDVLELHHVVKRGANGTQPTTLADLYGSAWITAGAGSVVLLWGAAGDPIVELRHLKQPAAEVGPLKISHDHDAGTSSVWHAADLLTLARLSGSTGITAKAAACHLFATDKPTPAETEKARRRLDRHVRESDLAFAEGDKTVSRPAVWTVTDPFTDPITVPSEPRTLHGITDPSRGRHISAGQRPSRHPSRPSRPRPSRFSPLFRGGEREAPDGRPAPCDECGHHFHSTTCSQRTA